MRLFVLLSALLVATSAPAQQPIDPRAQARIDRILKKTPLIDGHNDLPWELRQNHEYHVEGLESGTAQREKPLMTDIARLRAGRVGAQLWSVYISAATKGDEAIRQTIEQIDAVDRLVKAYPNDLEWARTADDIVRIHKAGKVASMAGIEGGDQTAGNLAVLRQFYRLGARYMTLTHSKTTDWADSATDAPKHGGLSPFGVKVVQEMNRLGMLVDLSHVSEETMADALDATKAPVIFSHSSARAVNHHPRNVPDPILQRLPANGGVVMINFYTGFVSEPYRQWAARKAAEEARQKSLNPGDPKAAESGLNAWVAANPAPEAMVSEVADHIDHVAKVAGHDHVGIGADLDGIDIAPKGLDSVDGYPLVFAELIRRGWSDENLAKLAGGNFLRVLRQAEAVAASMKDVPAPLDKAPVAP
ncbi:MAG TPA: dipeptidase [Sphingomicrobium sp.]|nr:dipeptidase [Sphingomicrobium sp.]